MNELVACAQALSRGASGWAGRGRERSACMWLVPLFVAQNKRLKNENFV